MFIARTVYDLRRVTGSGPRILLPTMGNLHEGHLSLVKLARERSGTVITSIFVNRLQFAPREDYLAYPRTLDRDCELLSRGGCDVVFAPAEEEIYPEPQECKINPPQHLAATLEGIVLPGFFTGVCTAVAKLFNLVQPSIAVFGKKDYQQLLVIRSMVRQLSMPVEIIAAETARDPTGLALSSRNRSLTLAQLSEARRLNAVLGATRAAIKSGRTDWGALERQGSEALTAHGWRPDYVAIRNQIDLKTPAVGDRLVIVGAASLGGTRLIDSLEL